MSCKNIDEYIAQFPAATQRLLKQMRKAIADAVPNAVEVISYGMPAFKQNKVLVYFAGYANHIGFYPTPDGIAKFDSDLDGYKRAKGSVQFPISEPLPLTLIKTITRYRAEEDAREFGKN